LRENTPSFDNGFQSNMNRTTKKQGQQSDFLKTISIVQNYKDSDKNTTLRKDQLDDMRQMVSRRNFSNSVCSNENNSEVENVGNKKLHQDST
jgi:hypothetical protein